jgi:hypothetical protein
VTSDKLRGTSGQPSSDRETVAESGAFERGAKVVVQSPSGEYNPTEIALPAADQGSSEPAASSDD